MGISKNRNRQFLRTAMLLLPFGTGILFQELGGFSWRSSCGVNISLWYIRICLMVMFYLIILKIDFRRLMPSKEHLLILAANVGMGVIPFLLLESAGLHQLALAAFFIGITPTANAAAVVMDFLDGKVEFVLTGFAMTNLFAGFAMTGLLPWVTGKFSLIFVREVAISLFTVAGIPFLAALLTRAVFRVLKKSVPKAPSMFSFFLWSSTLFVISASSTRLLRENPQTRWSEVLLIAALSFVICILNFAIGTLAGCRRYRREASQTLGQKNTTLTIFLALSFSTPQSALGPTFYVLWHNLWNALQIYRHDNRKTSDT